MTGRFAIYAVPGVRSADPVGVLLRQRAEQWLGRSLTHDPVTPAIPAGWTRAAVDAITVDARRYGFHGTLKAPFRLAEGRTPAELDIAVARFAAATAGTVIPQLALARLGGFFALVPGTQAPGLHALADEAVRAFDEFRGPPTEAELARRHRAARTPRQRELLDAWGYPYVLDQFLFHLTLTDRLPTEQRPQVERTLTDWFAALLGADVPVDALAVCTEAEPGAPFELRSVHRLKPTQAAGRPGEPTHREGAR